MINGIGYYFYESANAKEIFYVYKMKKTNMSFRSRIIVSCWGIPEFKDDEDNIGYLQSSYDTESKILTDKHIQGFIKDIFADKRIFIERENIK